MPEPVWPKPPAAPQPQGRINLMAGERELTTGLLAKEASFRLKPGLTSGLPRLRKGHPGVGRGASVPRSHRRCRPQACRFNSAGFSFGFAGRGQLLILPFKLTLRRGRHRPQKSGGPPLFAPSLKVQGDDTHNNSRFSVIPGPQSPIAFWVVWTAMGTSVFRLRTAVDFPPVLKSDHTMRSCRAASLHAGWPVVYRQERIRPS